MMNTSMWTVVFVSASLVGQNPTPTWHESYSQAQQQGVTQKKPLAVVFGSGSNGWTQVVRQGSPAQEVQQLLHDNYVCVYADVNTEAGKKLARDFGIRSNVGLVLSDRSGSLQALWHQGDMTSQMLAMYLRKYSDPQVVVRTTEVTLPMTRFSFYPQLDPNSPTQPVIGPDGRMMYYPQGTMVSPTGQPLNTVPFLYDPYMQNSFYPPMYSYPQPVGRRGRR